jgi:membrane protein DedA with SNARE-associated domain
MRASRFLPLNAVAAIGWAVVYGGAAFFLGPSIAGALGDLGLLVPVAIAVLVLAVLLIRRIRGRPLLRNRKIRLREG